MNKIKRISIKEFRESGYLQELNRTFLHPLGLALEVIIDNGDEVLGGIWDYRKDKEGIHYALNDKEFTDKTRLNNFRRKSEFVQSEIKSRNEDRVEKLGYFIEVIPDETIQI